MSGAARRPGALAAVVAAAAAFALLSGDGAVAVADSGARTTTTEPPPSRLLVTAREFGFSLSRPKLEAGPSIIQMYNYGEDPHDLNLQRIGGTTVSEIGEVAPGETGQIELKLRRGSVYRLWCSIPGHEELGMVAALKTSAKRPPRSR